MPIKARIDMLSTGIRTPIGIKVFGKDLQQIETVARDIERVVRSVPVNPMPTSRSWMMSARTLP